MMNEPFCLGYGKAVLERMAEKFKPGQRVRVKSGKRKGIEGTMIRSRFISKLGFRSYYVEFDTGTADDYYSSNFTEDELEAI